MTSSSRIDDQIFLSINDWATRTPALHTPARLYAGYGVVLFAVLLGIAAWRGRHADDAALARATWAALITPLAVAAVQPLVGLVHAARPYTIHPSILVLANRTSDASFPSDHATMAGACAMALTLFSRRLGALAWTMAALMAAARVYTAAHFPLDVIAGLAIGAVLAAAGWAVLRHAITLGVATVRTWPLVGILFAPAPAP